jgi:hypothetical protein
LDDFDKRGEDKDATDKETISIYPFREQLETEAKKPVFLQKLKFFHKAFFFLREKA